MKVISNVNENKNQMKFKWNASLTCKNMNEITKRNTCAMIIELINENRYNQSNLKEWLFNSKKWMWIELKMNEYWIKWLNAKKKCEIKLKDLLFMLCEIKVI